ncbi:9222_t:CDS:2, partial [Rhizophagus irregularis]
FIEEALVVNEFNLYWKRILIAGNYGGWRKKCTEAVWKNEILNSGKLEDLFYLTLNASLIDSKDRTYKIKNLIKELPTYSVLEVNGIKICEESVYKYEEELLKEKKLEEVKILRTINMDFIRILYQ